MPQNYRRKRTAKLTEDAADAAEKWFKERREHIKKPSHCKKCKSQHINLVTIDCCKSKLCLECISFESALYNRCYSCKSVIDNDKYQEYDGLDLQIPTFDDFEYIIDNIPTITPLNTDNINQTVEQSYDLQHFEPESQEIMNLFGENYQLYLQYLLLCNICSQQQPQ
jgi:hypothetical protein